MLDQPDDANVIDLVPDAGWSDGAARSCGAPGARVTSHGKATCRWSLGHTAAVDGALFPDGTRGRAEDVEMFSAGKGWRRPDGAGGWIFGTVALRDDDAVFADAPVQPHADWRRLDGNPDMGADLAAGRVLAGPAGAGFAQALYAAMCDTDWRKAGSRGRWRCSWPEAAGLVADLNGHGEIYLDYYCSGIGIGPATPEGTVRDDVRRALAAIGWHPVTGWRKRADRCQERLGMAWWRFSARVRRILRPA